MVLHPQRKPSAPKSQNSPFPLPPFPFPTLSLLVPLPASPHSQLSSRPFPLIPSFVPRTAGRTSCRGGRAHAGKQAGRFPVPQTELIGKTNLPELLTSILPRDSLQHLLPARVLLHERRHVVHRAVDDDVDVVEFVVRCYVGGGEGLRHSDCGEGGGGDGGEGGGKDWGG